jgi:hypothetical protein
MKTPGFLTVRVPVLMFLTSAVLFAQSTFDGTWRVNLQNTEYVGKENFSLQNGVYRCRSCVPMINVKADGQDHEVSGSPYFDMINVRVVDDRTVESVSKKGGKLTGTSKVTASQDERTLTTEFSYVTENGQNVTGKYTSARVDAAKEGAHKISGVWQPGKLESASENYITVTYKATDDGLRMTNQTGGSYTAKFDGKDYPFKGDPGVTSVSLQKSNANTIEETTKRNGKVIGVTRMTVAADGKMISVNNENRLEGVTLKWTMEKQ